MKKIIALPIALCIACSTGTHHNYPEEARSYSETVVVPGMSKEDLELKLALFRARNGGFTYSAEPGKYQVRFSASGSSPSEINTERNKMYAKSAELRKAVYSLPLDNEGELLEKASQLFNAGRESEAAEIFYKIALANPQLKPAAVFYAENLFEKGHYDEAVKILYLVQDVEGVPEMIAEANAIIAERNAKAAAEAHERYVENQRRAEEYRQQREAEQMQRWEDFNKSLNDYASKYGKGRNNANCSTCGTSTDTQPQTQTQSSSYSNNASASKRNNYNCGLANTKYNSAASRAKSLSDRYSPGDHSVASQFRDRQREMAKIRNEASKNGCNSVVQSVWETKSL